MPDLKDAKVVDGQLFVTRYRPVTSKVYRVDIEIDAVDRPDAIDRAYREALAYLQNSGHTMTVEEIEMAYPIANEKAQKDRG